MSLGFSVVVVTELMRTSRNLKGEDLALDGETRHSFAQKHRVVSLRGRTLSKLPR